MRLPKFVLAAGLMIAFSGFLTANTASATDYYHASYTPVVHCEYKTVIVYVEKEVSYQRKVVRYRSCGTPYYTWVTAWKTIEVPVKVRVKTGY